jgi:hypothetical protein
MDPLSITASVIAILQLTAEVIKYLGDVKDAPKECQQCTTEASNLRNLLINLLHHLAQLHGGDPWVKAVQDLNASNGPLDQYKHALEQLQSKVEIQNGTQKVKRRLLWKFSKAEVASILARMERLKSLISIALQMDHLSVLSYKMQQQVYLHRLANSPEPSKQTWMPSRARTKQSRMTPHLCAMPYLPYTRMFLPFETLKAFSGMTKSSSNTKQS